VIRDPFSAVFLYGGIRVVQAGRYVPCLWGWLVIIGGGIKTRGIRTRENRTIRTGCHLQAGVYYHCIPKCVLLY